MRERDRVIERVRERQREREREGGGLACLNEVIRFRPFQFAGDFASFHTFQKIPSCSHIFTPAIFVRQISSKIEAILLNYFRAKRRIKLSFKCKIDRHCKNKKFSSF